MWWVCSIEPQDIALRSVTTRIPLLDAELPAVPEPPENRYSGIAQAMYGDAGRWPEIFEANKDKISDPNLIHPGQELRIP